MTRYYSEPGDAPAYIFTIADPSAPKWEAECHGPKAQCPHSPGPHKIKKGELRISSLYPAPAGYSHRRRRHDDSGDEGGVEYWEAHRHFCCITEKVTANVLAACREASDGADADRLAIEHVEGFEGLPEEHKEVVRRDWPAMLDGSFFEDQVARREEEREVVRAVQRADRQEKKAGKAAYEAAIARGAQPGPELMQYAPPEVLWEMQQREEKAKVARGELPLKKKKRLDPCLR